MGGRTLEQYLGGELKGKAEGRGNGREKRWKECGGSEGEVESLAKAGE